MISNELVEQAVTTARKSRANYDYFFGKINSTDWIEPLAKHGFFKDPPKPISDGQYVRFPDWPESRYLARVAAKAPEAVAAIIAKMPVVENPRVVDDLADAALQMPPEVAAGLSKRFIESLQTAHGGFFSATKLGELAGRLISGGKDKQGLSLFRSLFRLEEVPPNSGESEGVRSRVESYEFGEILKRFGNPTAVTLGYNGFRILCDVLRDYMQIRYKGDQSKDLSFIHRRAIEDHLQNSGHDLIDPIIESVRDAAEHLVRAQPELLAQIVTFLSEQPWSPFRRIGMNLLATQAAPAQELVALFLVSEEAFREPALRHEYAALSTAHFGRLSAEQQETVLGWIDSAYGAKARESAGSHGDASKIEAASAAVERKRLGRLAPIKGYLEGERKAEFERLAAAHGEPEHPDFLIHSGGVFVGPTSPLSAEAIREMSPQDAVAFLGNWVPDTARFEAPTPEGLGRALLDAVAARAADFSAASEAFSGLEPTYIRSFLAGIETAVRAGSPLAWPNVLNLCLWVLGQDPERTETGGAWGDSDPGWSWTRGQIAGLLDRSFDTAATSPPFELRDLVWQLIDGLLNDPDPTPDYELQYGGSNMDPSTLSLNAVRGKAMHAAVKFILWSRSNAEPGTEFSLASVPEVVSAIEQRLDTEKEPSLAIRSVFGQYSPWLAMADESWYSTHREQIFPQEAEQAEYRRAAWNAYVVFCQPFNQMLRLLKAEYGMAISDAASGVRSSSFGDPEKQLATHILVFYGRGLIDMSEGDLVARLFAETPIEVRAKGLREIGITARNSPKHFSQETIERFRVLWAHRLEAAKASPEAVGLEVMEFGWWFSAGIFDPVWAIPALASAAKVAKGVEPSHLVLERLAEIAHVNPPAALDALRSIMNGDKTGWGRYMSQDHVKTILGTILNSEDEGLRKRSVEFVHLLGAKGLAEYRDLIR